MFTDTSSCNYCIKYTEMLFFQFYKKKYITIFYKYVLSKYNKNFEFTGSLKKLSKLDVKKILELAM